MADIPVRICCQASLSSCSVSAGLRSVGSEGTAGTNPALCFVPPDPAHAEAHLGVAGVVGSILSYANLSCADLILANKASSSGGRLYGSLVGMYTEAFCTSDARLTSGRCSPLSRTAVTTCTKREWCNAEGLGGGIAGSSAALGPGGESLFADGVPSLTGSFSAVLRLERSSSERSDPTANVCNVDSAGGASNSLGIIDVPC